MTDKKKITAIIQGQTERPLVIFEMANNHMGDVEYGLKIIRDIREVSKNYDFNFAFKFQLRHIDTFIHPDFKDRLDHKYVRRFQETRLSPENFLALKREAENLGFITICTPFDEPSVDTVAEMGFDILKVGSCSFTDWPLWEKIGRADLPIIASTATTPLSEIDKVVTFLKNRNKNFALMHCVGQYPTRMEDLELNQLDLLRARYPEINIGFSTHEEPDNTDAVKMAVSKGVKILERHVATLSEEYDINVYSSTPAQIDRWLAATVMAERAGGIRGDRHTYAEKELSDIRQFQRGAYLKRDIAAGEIVGPEDLFYAWPNQPGQLLANDITKYKIITVTKDLPKSAPLTDVTVVDNREKVLAIVRQAAEMVKAAHILINNQLSFEISHHYGIDRFYECGAVIISCVNREYCKKLIVILPGQKHPAHFHRQKEETFHVLYGEMTLGLGEESKKCVAGDIVTVERGVNHDFRSDTGCIFEEVSSTHYADDSFYADESILRNKQRKTRFNFWLK